MLISYSKAQGVDESSFLIIAGRDGRKADAEQSFGGDNDGTRHTYIVWPPLRSVCSVCHAGHVRGLSS